jgi:hypothetical protein
MFGQPYGVRAEILPTLTLKLNLQRENRCFIGGFAAMHPGLHSAEIVHIQNSFIVATRDVVFCQLYLIAGVAKNRQSYRGDSIPDLAGVDTIVGLQHLRGFAVDRISAQIFQGNFHTWLRYRFGSNEPSSWLCSAVTRVAGNYCVFVPGLLRAIQFASPARTEGKCADTSVGPHQ